jgi:hypothetical protein
VSVFVSLSRVERKWGFFVAWRGEHAWAEQKKKKKKHEVKREERKEGKKGGDG